MNEREINLAIGIAKDIIRDIQGDRELLKCRTFSQLHDLCDANCLGGLCEDSHRIWQEENWQDITIHAQELAAKWLSEFHRGEEPGGMESELRAFCFCAGFPLLSADDLASAANALKMNPAQREWLAGFVLRWFDGEGR